VLAAAMIAALLWYGYGIGPHDSVFVAVGAGLALWSARGLLFSRGRPGLMDGAIRPAAAPYTCTSSG